MHCLGILCVIAMFVSSTIAFRLHQLPSTTYNQASIANQQLASDQFANATLTRSSSYLMELRLSNRIIKLLNVPDVMQATEYTCGPSSLSAVLSYYNKDYRQSYLAGLAKTDKNYGTGPLNLLSAIRHLNISAQLKQAMTISDLQSYLNDKKPIIVQIQAWADPGTNYPTDFDDGHYVVVIGYDPTYLYFQDPWILGSIGYIKKSQFVGRWHDKVHSQHRNVFQLGIIVDLVEKRYGVVEQLE